jgi:hypothetical protein
MLMAWYWEVIVVVFSWTIRCRELGMDSIYLVSLQSTVFMHLNASSISLPTDAFLA